jgi:hypothetical protein
MNEWFRQKAEADLKQRNNEIELVQSTLLVAARKYDEGDNIGKHYWRRKALLFSKEFGVTENDLPDSHARRVLANVWWIPRV